MSMYAPDGKVVLLVCFDRRHHVALARRKPKSRGPALTLPSTQRRGGESYKRAAARLAGMMAAPGTIRPGKVTGRIPGALPDAPPIRRCQRRIFTAHTSSPAQLNPPTADTCLEWLPYRHVAPLMEHLGILDLDVFLEGYVGGWIPDGWITLQRAP